MVVYVIEIRLITNTDIYNLLGFKADLSYVVSQIGGTTTYIDNATNLSNTDTQIFH